MRIFWNTILLTWCLSLIFLGHAARPRIKPVISIGSEKAPLVITEFVAPTCHVCADFSQSLLPKLKQHYIDKGLMRLIIVPLPYNYIDLRAATIIFRSPNPVTTYEYVFKNQEQWAGEKNPLDALVSMLIQKGIPKKATIRTKSSKRLENLLIKTRMDIEKKYDVDAIPVCFIGQRKIVGLVPWKELQQHINEALVFLKKGGRIEAFGQKDEEQSKNKRKKRSA